MKMIAAGGGLAVVLGGGAFALINGGSDADDEQVARAGPATTTTSRAQPSTSVTTPATTGVPDSTTTSPTTAATSGSSATQTTARPQADGSVLELQQRLADLGYDVGSIDGFAGWQTYYAIAAFQKVEGLRRTGEDNAEVREALATATRPGPMVPGGESDRVEIDLNRQVLFLWRGGALTRILPVSTGNGEYYCEAGQCDTAITPTGTFRIGRKARGLEVSHLGELYDPMYFYGGIAIHGSPSIPGYPASHGCVRIPMYASPTLFDQVPAGTVVYVVGDGPAASDVPPPPDDPVTVDPTPPVVPEPDPEPVPTSTTTTTEPVPTTPSSTVPTLGVPGGSTGG